MSGEIELKESLPRTAMATPPLKNKALWQRKNDLVPNLSADILFESVFLPTDRVMLKRRSK